MSALLTDLAAVWDLVRPVIGIALCLLGVSLAVIGTAGVLRFPDFYTRLHAASVTDTSAATSLLVGMALMAPNWMVIVKLVMIWVFLFLTGPTATHAVANAAHMAGLQAWTRPGKGAPQPATSGDAAP
ncbi:MAG: monovalent cation/H(+) antiporter subunit G [Pseudomonadota bacterium]